MFSPALSHRGLPSPGLWHCSQASGEGLGQTAVLRAYTLYVQLDIDLSGSSSDMLFPHGTVDFYCKDNLVLSSLARTKLVTLGTERSPHSAF